MKITIHLDKSLEENAGLYFDKAKKSRRKIEGARKAVVEAEKKLVEAGRKELREGEKKRAILVQSKRKRAWYEKFRWFYTSNGFLVVGGRDASTNEIVVKKHADKNDYVYHTEMPGSPFAVLKNPDGLSVDEESRRQAAVFTATFSKAWEAGVRGLDVFEVRPDQVTKEARAGEYVAKGAFMVYGQRKNYDVPLSLALGVFEDDSNGIIVMSGPEEAVKSKCSKFVVLKQGSKKKGEISKVIMRELGLHTNEDILSSLPSGGFDIEKKAR